MQPSRLQSMRVSIAFNMHCSHSSSIPLPILVLMERKQCIHYKCQNDDVVEVILMKVDVFAAIASFFADLMPYLACWRAARVLHEMLLDNVLKAPLQFFEVTPVGRILSRFSKDVDVVDTSLPSQASDVIYCAFEVILF